ncbi:MAG TPA: MFS transporter, partial [Chloroflexota bacterium]|nr:MFS transporter [Chloroflexota bacterium]
MTTDPLEAGSRRATLSIAAAIFAASGSTNFWYPFLPLFLLDIGAKDDKEAVFWLAVASAAQGLGRLAAGPIWGVVSDRFGRKAMFLRALYLGAAVGLILGAVQRPWQVALALGFQGLFGGFNPAATALISVSVPDSRLNRALSTVTGAQYLGNTVGPAIGAALAIALGYRGAILIAAGLPAVVGTFVIFLVPNDQPASTRVVRLAERARVALEPFHPTFQFWLAVLVYFAIVSMTGMIRVALPISLRDIENGANVAGVSGLAFTLGGLGAAFSVFVLGTRFFRSGQMRSGLVVFSLLTGAAQLLLAASHNVPSFVAVFALISLLQAAMIPATNTLIAANAPRSRRGTAFGLASSAQAIA